MTNDIHDLSFLMLSGFYYNYQQKPLN
jgi:hypothetical protein